MRTKAYKSHIAHSCSHGMSRSLRIASPTSTRIGRNGFAGEVPLGPPAQTFGPAVEDRRHLGPAPLAP